MASLSRFMGFGGLTNQGFKYRARLDGPGTLKLRYSTDKTFATYSESPGVDVTIDDDYTGGEEITGLQPDTTYYCQPVADGVVSGLWAHDNDPPRVNTSPSGSKSFKFAFGGDSDSTDAQPWNFWPAVAQFTPDFFIHLGDFGGIDSQDTGVQAEFYQSQFETGYSFVPHVAYAGGIERIWSDHDYGVSNGDGEAAGKDDALDSWKRYTPHADLANTGEGMWRSWRYGQAELFMLDCRSQKMPLTNSDRWPTVGADTVALGADSTLTGVRMLITPNAASGEEDYYAGWYFISDDYQWNRNTYATVHTTEGQWRRVLNSWVDDGDLVIIPDSDMTYASQYGMLVNASVLDGITPLMANNQVDWLVDSVKASNATWKIICSDFVMNNTHVVDDNWRKYSGHQMNGEVRYLRHALTGVDGVVVLSGDSHRTQFDDGTNSPFPEACISPMTTPPFTEGAVATWSNGQITWPPTTEDPDAIGFTFGIAEFTTNPDTATITAWFSGANNPTAVGSVSPLSYTILGGPVVPSQFEGTNVYLRGSSDVAFKWRMPGIGPIDFGSIDDIPTMYRLEVTPDLGWANTDELFTAYDETGGNSRLSVFLADSADVTGDEQEVEFVLDSGEWASVIRPRFERYLWRVAGIDTGGDIGEYSDVQTFKLISEVPDSSWSVNQPSSPVGWTQVIEGYSDPTVETIEVLGFDPQVDFSQGRFHMEIPLQAGEETLYFRARNIKGETSTYRTLRVDIQTSSATPQKVWNTFDEHGLMLATPRLPDEDNVAYRERLSDVMRHRGGPQYQGLKNALTRDLGLLDDQYDTAMTVRRSLYLNSAMAPEGALLMSIGSRKVHLSGDLFVHYQEVHTVNPHTWGFTLDDPSESLNIEMEVEGLDVPRGHYRVNGQDVLFTDPSYLGKTVRVSYRYRETIGYSDLTMVELKETLEAIQIEGQQLLEVDLQSGVNDFDAAGIDQIISTPITNVERSNLVGDQVTGVPVRWSPVYLWALQDDEFLDYHKNEFGNHFLTQVDGWAQRLESRFQLTWEHVVADQGHWFSEDQFNGHAGLTATLDLPLTFWVSTKTGTRYTTRQYVALGGVCPVDGSKLIREGLPIEYLKSGVAPGPDLMVRMSPEETLEESTPEDLLSIVRDLQEFEQGPEAPEVI